MWETKKEEKAQKSNNQIYILKEIHVLKVSVITMWLKSLREGRKRVGNHKIVENVALFKGEGVKPNQNS